MMRNISSNAIRNTFIHCAYLRLKSIERTRNYKQRHIFAQILCLFSRFKERHKNYGILRNREKKRLVEKILPGTSVHGFRACSSMRGCSWCSKVGGREASTCDESHATHLRVNWTPDCASWLLHYKSLFEDNYRIWAHVITWMFSARASSSANDTSRVWTLPVIVVQVLLSFFLVRKSTAVNPMVLDPESWQVDGLSTVKTACCSWSQWSEIGSFVVGLQLFIVEIHNGKIHMYFVTPVLYQITCITSNMDLQDTDSNVVSCVLI